jgi:large subunit ribosomal protein L29
MPQVKARQLREKTLEELHQHVGTLREQMFKLRFQKATGQAESPQKIVLVRKELARVLTLITEKTAGRS